ncbi:hypothetical protein [Stackebrandtia soli]|uniref:hypothetical protein n=1 Tax=Stackebrandtia soli TaxID=1892856 RepID=UPI0039E9C3A1
MIPPRTVAALAVFAAMQATFDGVHSPADQIVQTCGDAAAKGRPGHEGRAAAARHAASYTATQTIAMLAVTRLLGYRPRTSAVAAAAAITGVSHYAIDRRAGFIKLLHRLGKKPYLDHATVQRRDGVVDAGGPGTALMELDQAAHRGIGVVTTAIAAYLATR